MNNLNPKVFDKGVEQKPIRQGFGEGLLEVGKKDKRIVGLCCDLTGSTKMNIFAEEFPERFFQMGITEQSMASVASGMAAMGKIPFISSYAMFSPGRNWEQIRTTICYNNSNVKIVGSHAGVSVGPDGGTHQAIEDIAITRVIPNMQVIVPCDAIEAQKATLAMSKTNSPTYLRLAREATPIITTEETPFIIGKSQVVFSENEDAGIRVGLIACGAVLHNTLIAARALAKDGIGVSVMNLATIKPLDKEGVLDFAKNMERIVTVEEHQIAGGMGSAVAEFLASTRPTPIEFVGVEDKFGQSGTPDELIKHYGIDADSVIKKANHVLHRK